MHATTSIIALRNLRFGYERDQTVLKDLNLTVPYGAIYGFLGANGAGKSTTIRAMLGLLRSQQGEVQLFGRSVAANRLQLHRRIGSLIESPSLYLHLSGYDNLKIACQYWNLPRRRIDEVLELVNLSHAARKAGKNYSTGMKQRLGLAIALLPDPELLILDEPTNGLDPNGIIEIRAVLQRLHGQGKTIFLSSHLLAEVERIATQVGIIKDGALVFQGMIGELERLRTQQLQVQLITSDAYRVAGLFRDHYSVETLDDQRLQLIINDPDQLPAITRQVVNSGIDLYECRTLHHDLEQLFIHLTNGTGIEQDQD